jgi:hypothetical protein
LLLLLVALRQLAACHEVKFLLLVAFIWMQFCGQAENH